MSAMRTTVLVVDDDADFRGLAAFVVASQGLIAVEAADCEECLEVLRKGPERIFAVLLDYYMPGMKPGPCVAGIRELLPATVPVAGAPE